MTKRTRTLPNGATILQIYEADKFGAVLAETSTDYVTWLFETLN